MGMYSFFEDENISITDLKGLKNFLTLFKKEISNNDYYDVLKVDEANNEYVTFEEWDNHKIISYWYDETVIFLMGIGKFISGYVKWSFETEEETGEVIFQDGKTIFNLGHMEYGKYNGEQLITNVERYDKIRTIIKLM